MKICKKCPKTSNDFKNDRSFYQHKKTHEEKNEECHDCQKLFRTKIDFSSHRNNVHEEKQEFKCSNIIVAILWTLFSKISSCRFFQILREYENKLYTVKL